MGVPTYLMEYSGDQVVKMDGGGGPLQFQGPLGAFGQNGNWSLVLYALPPGKGYTDAASEATTEIPTSCRAQRISDHCGDSQVGR